MRHPSGHLAVVVLDDVTERLPTWRTHAQWRADTMWLTVLCWSPRSQRGMLRTARLFRNLGCLPHSAGDSNGQGAWHPAAYGSRLCGLCRA